MAEFFNEAGWTIYPTTLFGALALISSLVLATRPERRFVPLFLSFLALTALAGFQGTMLGITGVVKAAVNAEVTDRADLMTACATQAMNSVLIASIFMVLAILAASSGALRVAIARTPAVAS